jgi:hypothetical protein
VPEVIAVVEQVETVPEVVVKERYHDRNQLQVAEVFEVEAVQEVEGVVSVVLDLNRQLVEMHRV